LAPSLFNLGRRMRVNAFGGPLVAHPLYRKDNPMNDHTDKTSAELGSEAPGGWR
jgi:hypothetical protein